MAPRKPKTTPASPSEYVALCPPLLSRLSPQARDTSTYFLDRIKLNRMFAEDPELEGRIKTHINEFWWKGMCESVNKEEFYGVLFEEYMFDGEGLLDVEAPALSRVKEILSIAYMHILTKSRLGGPESLPNWHVSWSQAPEKGSFILLTNDVQRMVFGMVPPEGGYFDHAGEIAALRKERDDGIDVSNSDDKKKFDGLGQVAAVAAAATGGSTSSGKESNIPIDGDDLDDADFDEARENAPNEGFVYNVNDAKKPVKKGWLW